MQAREWHHVRTKLAKIAVELAREPNGARDTRQASRHEVIQITIRRGRQLESAEADIVQGLVVEGEREIRVLDELMNRQGAVVRLDDRVAHLRRGHNRVGRHHAVRVLLADLGDQQGTHTGSRAATEGVRHLEALEAVASLSLLADNIEDRVNELGSLGVMSLSPVVARAPIPALWLLRPGPQEAA